MSTVGDDDVYPSRYEPMVEDPPGSLEKKIVGLFFRGRGRRRRRIGRGRGRRGGRRRGKETL